MEKWGGGGGGGGQTRKKRKGHCFQEDRGNGKKSAGVEKGVYAFGSGGRRQKGGSLRNKKLKPVETASQLGCGVWVRASGLLKK